MIFMYKNDMVILNKENQSYPSFSNLYLFLLTHFQYSCQFEDLKLQQHRKKGSKMLNSRDTHFTLQFIIIQICKQGFCNRPQLLYAVWQSTKKVITNNWSQGRETALSNIFIARGNREFNKFYFYLQPTESLLADCALKYRAENVEFIQAPTLIGQTNLFKNLNQSEKEYFKNDKELVVRFFYLIIGKIKELLKAHRNLEIFFEHFGIIKVNQKTYFFQSFKFNDKGSLSSPNLQKYKRFSSTKKQNLTSQRSGDQSKINSRLLDAASSSEKRSFNLRKRPYFHEAIVQNEPPSVKICSDLLGAGIDPLTYDYNYSKLIDNSPQLLNMEFKRQDHAQGRLPCVIDKFARTKGSQLTGIKEGNSIVVRIGSNYSPTARNYYLDITSRSIQLITAEVKIKLQNPRQRAIQPATQSQQYLFLTGVNSQLQSKIQLRKEMYLRYQQYYREIIPNDCVAPLKQESIERIVKQIKGLVRKLGRKDGSPLINSLMNEVNSDYYMAYKRSVLNYILRDKEEMLRIGISITFNNSAEWGKPIHRKLLLQNVTVNINQSKTLLQLNHILYPECLNKIYEENEKLVNLEIFKKRKEGQYRPYNLLYYIKRNVNQLNQAYAFLCDSWVKRISILIEEYINLKQQNYQKLKQFFNSIHIVMSNKLKELLYVTLYNISQEFSKFEGMNQQQSKNLLMINMTQQGQKITFIDDIQKVFKQELVDIVQRIIEVTRRIPRVQNFLKLSTQLFIWGIDVKDTLLAKTKQKIRDIIDQNYVKVLQLRSKLSNLQAIFKLKQQIIQWCKQSFKIEELKDKLFQIDLLQKEILKVKCYYKVSMVVVDCIQLKRKLLLHLKSLRKLMFDNVEERVKQRNNVILTKITANIQLVSKCVLSTTQFLSLAQDIEKIKHKQMGLIRAQIDNSFKEVMNLFSLQGFSANYQVMKSTYICRQSFEDLHFQLYKNQRRLSEERGELEKRLRQKINHFQTQTLTWLKQINSKIETFDMRKLFSEYLAILADYRSKVQSNREVQRILNCQQQDLKWATTTFTHAIELQNVVQPNYELWQLVSEYDSCIKQWKYIELSHFDIQNSEIKVVNIDNRITRLITKLKNFAGLKIVYDLQNDVKEFLVQQVPIIKIFSNPGLKDRHWSLFNKRLPLPGYDLKQLTYGRIKLLYEYEKNLKVLMSISNQAAKQFQIQNEKQEMFEYWSKLNFALYHANDENIIFINQNFLDEQIQVIQHHLTKTIILKNSPFSKALVQMLSQWQGWLINGRKILTGFRASQQKFMIVRSIFKMDQINKILPIESTEYDSIENIWKSVIKKILEQPKVTQFFKSQKMPQIIEQIGKKADFIRNSFNTYLNLKRLEFNRLYFLPEKIVLNLIEFLAADLLQDAYQLILQKCFIGINNIHRDDCSSFELESRVDSLQLICESIHTKKGKSKFFDELVILQKNMRQNIKKQIKQITYINQPIQQVFDVFTVTAIFTNLQLQFGSKIQKGQRLQQMKEYFRDLEYILIVKIKEFPCLKYENLLSKIIFLKWRCEELSKRQSVSAQSILHFCQNGQDFQLRIYNYGIKYQFEYLGDEVPCYIPTDTDRLVWHIAFSINHKVGIICEKNTILREIALWTGQYFVHIDNPLHSIQSNFESCIMGIVSTSYWIHFIDDYIKINAALLGVLTHTFQMKKQKIGKQQNTLIFKNNQLTINPYTCLLLSINSQKIKTIPDGLLTCMRSISISKPSLQNVKEYLKLAIYYERLKIYLFSNKVQCLQMKPNLILKELQSLGSWQQMKTAVKHKIWKYLNINQRLQFDELFQLKQQTEEIQYKNWSQFTSTKEQELRLALIKYSVVMLVGKQECKTTVIQNVLKQRNVEALFNQNRGVNLNFIEDGVSELSYIKYLQKARQKVIKGSSQIIVYIDCELSTKHLQAIQAFEHIHQLSPQHKKPIKIIAQTCSIDSLDPRSLVSYAIISFNQSYLDNTSVYQYWTNTLQLNSEDRANVLQLQMNFENMLAFVLRMQKRTFNDSRKSLTKRFFCYFKIYLAHLNSKEVERMCEFDKENYIFNSFIYCAFWALGGSLMIIQAQYLKKYIRQTYSEKLDIPGELDQIYLNQENEWVYWESLKQEFASQKQNIPLYQIWVPTANNTKVLTILIKLIQHNHSILLCGSQSGRSSIFAEISSFQLSYNTFLLDCHRKTSVNHITTLTRGRIIYGDFKKNLILVDDLHLPPQQSCDVLRTFMQWGYCSNSSLLGKLNQDIFKPLLLASWQGNEQNNRCFWRFYERMIPIQIEKFGQGELQTIFRTYFNSLLVSNQVDNSFLKLQNIIVNFCMHTLKVFPSITISNIRLLVESVCRFNLNKDEKIVLQHLLAESQSILQVKLPSHEITHFFRHMSYYYGKLLSIRLKNHNELKDVAQNYLYDVRTTKQADKKQTIDQLSAWMNECITDKSNQFFISNFHIKVLQKIIWSLKGNNSHIVLLSSVKNGCHSLAKMSCWLLKIGSIELQQIGVNGLLEQVVKVLKTGGKVDQCLSILTYGLINARPQLVKLVNSLIFSPEFHECFGQILMQQIIKSFNSQKKFLKKNVKRSELIKKIRQKFNGIFHFCLCLTKNSFETLLNDYPNFSYLRVIQLQQWPSQALSLVSKKFVPNQSDQVLRVVLRIEQQIKSNWQICGGKNNCKGVLKILSIFDKIVKFMQHKAKSQEQSTELWSKRIRMSQQKLQNLHKQKKLFESQHGQYFLKMSIYAHQISETTIELQNARQKHQQMLSDMQKCKKNCNHLKNQFQKSETEVHLEFFQYVQSLKTKLTLQSHNYKQNEKIQAICLVYEFPTDNIQQQLIQFLCEIEKDYFHKLLQLDYSDLGLITTVIDKFKERMEVLWDRQCTLSIKFKQYENVRIKQGQLAYNIKDIEDKICTLKDDQASLKENQEANIKSYQDLKDKISQIQSINSILLKFEHVLRSKNQLCIPLPKNLNGCAILVSFLLAYSLYLSFQQTISFVKMLTSKLEQQRFQASMKEILSFYNYELQFKMLNQYQSKIDEIVNLFGLQFSDIACITVGTIEDIIDWLSKVAESKHYVWMKDNEDIKDLLQRDQIILIKNPGNKLLQRMSNILSKPFVTRNNTKILPVDQQQMTIHQNSKCIFVYESSDQIPDQLLIHNLFSFKVYQNIEESVLKQLEKKMNDEGLIGNRNELVSNYLEGCRQISTMDEKLHSIIMKMKKENVVSEIIYKKIEEEGWNKLQNERKLQKYKLQIAKISKQMTDHNFLSKDISMIYTKFKKFITFKEFKLIMSAISSKISTQNLHEMIGKVYCYLDTLLAKQDQSNKIKEIQRQQFEEITIKIIQKTSILLISRDLSLAYRYVKTLLSKSSYTVLDIAPQHISINNIKDINNIYICLLTKNDQWKQTLSLIDSHRQKFSTFKIVYIVLDSMNISAQILLGINSLTLNRAGQLIIDLDEIQIGSISGNSLKLKKQGKSLYQQQLEYRTYLTGSQTPKQFKRQIKELLEIQT